MLEITAERQLLQQTADPCGIGADGHIEVPAARQLHGGTRDRTFARKDVPLDGETTSCCVSKSAARRLQASRL
jgi:hypothetical protein